MGRRSAGARWTAVLVALAMTALMAGLFILPLLVEHEYKGLLFVLPVFLMSLTGAAMLGIYALLVGYVYGDARRRGMNQVLWTLLAIFIPSAIGVILYFILRDPVPVPCPRCGTLALKGHASARAAGRSCGWRARSAVSRWSPAGATAPAGAALAGRPEGALDAVGSVPPELVDPVPLETDDPGVLGGPPRRIRSVATSNRTTMP